MVLMLPSTSLGPVVNILAIFSNANVLKNKRIKRYHVKGIGCPLLISINIDQETEKKNKQKNDPTGTQASPLHKLTRRFSLVEQYGYQS